MYKIKKGYILGNSFQSIIDTLKDNVDIIWYEPIKLTNKSKLDTIFWTNTKELLKSDYVLADEGLTNTFDLGVAWTINYVRKLLTRSGHKSAVKQLDKFELNDKKIIGLTKNINTLYQIAIQDQGKLFKSSKAIIKSIENWER